MDVSNHRKKPGHSPAVRLPSLKKIRACSLWLLLLLSSLAASTAQGFTIFNVGWGATVQVRASDIAEDGVSFGPSSEQVFDEGTLQTSLSDFSLPVDANLSAALNNRTMSTLIQRSFAFVVRLSRAEQNRCVGSEDLSIRMGIVGPVRDAFAATGPDGGTLRLLRFDPVYRGATGRRCPSNLFYGYTLELSVADAISAGTYEATAEIEVDLSGPGGGTQAVQVPLQVRMPGLLLLYHHSRINVDLAASALAGALGANRSCSSGFCMDLGNRVLPVSSLTGPINLNVSSDAGAAAAVQTITLSNAVGARAIGCSGNQYETATYQVLGVGGIQDSSGVLSAIQNAACGMELRTGDLSFDLDLTQVDTVTGTASATIQITVTGL